MLRQTSSSWSPTPSTSDDEDTILECIGKAKKLRTMSQHNIGKNELVACKGDETLFEENAVVSGIADGTSVRDDAGSADKAAGTAKSAVVAKKGAGSAKNAPVAGKVAGAVRNALLVSKGDETPIKQSAAVAGKGSRSPLKAKPAIERQKAESPPKENAAVARKGAGGPLKENRAGGGKREGPPPKTKGSKVCRPDVAVESPSRRRGIGRPVKGGQRGGRRRQDVGPNKGRKRALGL